jgi:hypothetical protein
MRPEHLQLSCFVHHLVFAPGCSGSVSFLQFLSALVATHFNCLAADLYLDRIAIERVVASRASFCSHDLFSLPEDRVVSVGHWRGKSRYQNL